jgi:phenylpropionate dioxygenase-like ring-hydroxylating dioxygenase large terminal subunit
MSDVAQLPIPFGWYCIGYADELNTGDVRVVQYFEREMVLFRTESGALGLVDPVCPHMGAHLGHGSAVVEESLRCPFHHWAYNTAGWVTDIPYAKAFPARAKAGPCLKTYPVLERSGLIWAWYHPADAAPSFEPEEHPEIGHPDWAPLDRYHWQFRSHPQEIAENGVDVAHFKYVHQMDAVPEGETSYDGFIRSSRISGPRTYTDASGTERTVQSKVEVRQVGAGQKSTRFSGIVDTLLLVLVTPIDRKNVDLRFAFTHLRYPEDSAEHQACRANIKSVIGQTGVAGDIPIWENKFHVKNPILCDGDGGVMRFRKYFSQFYVGGPYADQ